MHMKLLHVPTVFVPLNPGNAWTDFDGVFTGSQLVL